MRWPVEAALQTERVLEILNFGNFSVGADVLLLSTEFQTVPSQVKVLGRELKTSSVYERTLPFEDILLAWHKMHYKVYFRH